MKQWQAMLDPSSSDQAILREVVAFYARRFSQDADAQGYLERRGLACEGLAARFQLGCANRTLGHELPPRVLVAGKRIRLRLEQLGVIRASGHEHLNGALVVPILDATGTKVLDLYGRRLRRGVRPGTPQHLFLGDGPTAALFNAAALGDATQLILCGGVMDALTFCRHGFAEAVAAFGSGTFSERHVEMLTGRGLERLFVAFRRDADGDRDASRVAETLASRGVEVFRVVLPRGQDVNDFAVSVDAPAEALLTLLRHATWMGAGSRVSSVAPEGQSWPLFGGVGDESKPAIVTPERTTIDALLARGVAASDPAIDVFVEPPEPGNLAIYAAPDETKPPTPSPDELTLELGAYVWRVRGIARNTSPQSLKVNVLVAGAAGFHIDIVELYQARHRNAFVREAAVELGVSPGAIKRDLGKVLLQVETHHEAHVADAVASEPPAPAMSEAEREEALALLQDARLVDRIAEDLERCGVVGERTNKVVGYLAMLSRKLARPVGLMVRSSSAAGKSTLAEALSALVPPEDRVSFSAMTGQSMYDMARDALKHKVLAIAEDEGARKASYALKLLLSEGKLTIASTTKDATGRMVTETYAVEGPTQLLLTTTAIDVDEELLNRCIVLTVDEGREQTRAIHRRQREARTLDGILARRERARTIATHQNAQRLLEPLLVVNPYAERLTFVHHATRTRRDHLQYLTLIETIALLHQHQRVTQSVEHRGERLRYVEVEPSDVALANALCDEVLGRSLDELPPQTRRLLTLLDVLVAAACEKEGSQRIDFRFTRRWVRELSHWGDTQLRVHLRRLVELEYLLVHAVGRGHRFTYELCWDGRGHDGTPHLSGLLDPSELG